MTTQQQPERGAGDAVISLIRAAVEGSVEAQHVKLSLQESETLLMHIDTLAAAKARDARCEAHQILDIDSPEQRDAGCAPCLRVALTDAQNKADLRNQRLAAAEAQRARLERVLQRVEWLRSDRDQRERCPICDSLRTLGHSRDCWLGEALAPPSAAPSHSPECQVSRRYPFAAELSCTCRADPSGTDRLTVRADAGEA
jgi:hypothetical protein